MKPYVKYFCGKLTPNEITTLGIVPNVVLVYAVLSRNIPLAVVSIVARAFFDALDGMVARKCNQQSKFGHVYEHVVDMLSTIGLFSAALYTYWGAKTMLHVGIPVALVLFYMFITFIYDTDPNATESTPHSSPKKIVKRVSLFCADNSVLSFMLLYAALIYGGETFGTRA